MRAAKIAKWIVLGLFVSLTANVLVFSFVGVSSPDFGNLFAITVAAVVVIFMHEMRHR